jgi:hypothetical protein
MKPEGAPSNSNTIRDGTLGRAFGKAERSNEGVNWGCKFEGVTGAEMKHADVSFPGHAMFPT